MRWPFFILVSILFISGCHSVSVDQSVENGLVYLSENYDDGEYNDDYLKFKYEGEDLEFDMTYRKMDAFFNLIMMDELFENAVIDAQIREADSTFRKLMTVWENGKISNTIDSDGGGYALDTYCILGYLYENEIMAEVVADHLVEDNWLADNYYAEDVWRNIADETWCIRLLQVTGYNVTSLVDRLLVEGHDFIGSEDYNDIEKVAVAVHVAYVLDEVNHPDLHFYQEFLVDHVDEVQPNILLVANILEVLAQTHYAGNVDFIAEYLVSRQQEDGSWPFLEEETYLRSFTTFRAVLALGHYAL